MVHVTTEISIIQPQRSLKTSRMYSYMYPSIVGMLTNIITTRKMHV